MDPVFVIPGSSVTCHTFCLRDVNVRCVNARLFVSNMLFFLHFGEKKGLCRMVSWYELCVSLGEGWILLGGSIKFSDKIK